ncbi:MAG: tyrosine-type recombinase/integrase [Candidatus Brocadiales bacterium]
MTGRASPHGAPCKYHIGQKAGIKDFHRHDLRHTFASHLVMAGVDIRTVQDLLGHKTRAMTLRYAHLFPSHKAKAVRVLKEKLALSVDKTGGVLYDRSTI